MSGAPTVQQQQQYLQQVRAQVQSQMMQEVMTKMSEKCFKLCAGKKGDHLDTSEAQCVVHCMDRYMETMQVVSSSLQNRQHK